MSYKQYTTHMQHKDSSLSCLLGIAFLRYGVSQTLKRGSGLAVNLQMAFRFH